MEKYFEDIVERINILIDDVKGISKETDESLKSDKTEIVEDDLMIMMKNVEMMSHVYDTLKNDVDGLMCIVNGLTIAIKNLKDDFDLSDVNKTLDIVKEHKIATIYLMNK